ncbi:1-aminocyclopropane-1-carboxylate deaminase/D-cysteine desulfhydrase [Tenacibaculum sp. UWU-22]|uniref:1-aminocyclopropane-1-carboxylate deaminase/D-cysteine desulfhydrase n=1 Tax=Tenacibaculum sp. UWU-22 TaxID=3234187 RepID=UPI0034DAC1CA
MNNSIFDLTITTKNQQVFLPVLEKMGIELFIKREDAIHPFVSGNKFRKLKYNIKAAREQQKDTLLTFGGAFSNHIAATAATGKIAGFKTIGVVRGEELGYNLHKTLTTNTTLNEAYKNGMQLKFVTREAYRNKTSQLFIEQLKKEFGDFYLVPEGGTNSLAVKGCEEILTTADEKFDYICVAVGTGGTVSGLINSTKKYQKVIGFPALKGDFLSEEIKKYTLNNLNWSLVNEYHFGGYGKHTSSLISFINAFKTQTNILLDPIYTGKMLFGIVDLIKNNHFKEGNKILAIHTGGLQGINGVNQLLKQKNKELIII